MIGTIIGDVIGSPYESWMSIVRHKKFPLFSRNSRFTDDTVLSCAVWEALRENVPFHEKYKLWTALYPGRGYGAGYIEWFSKKELTHNDSYGNGCAMRISPLIFHAIKYNTTFVTLNELIKKSCQYTHEHEESYNGASAIATLGVLSHTVKDKEILKTFITNRYGYNLEDSVEDIRQKWNTSTARCSVTVPQAIICFLESTDFESAIRNAVYSTGDTDTVAAMAGSIAEWYYGIDSINPELIKQVRSKLDPTINTLLNNYLDERSKL